MKKILSLTLAVIMCFAAATTLVSCGHEHEYKTDWSSDATHHWHACNDAECTEPADKAEHTWDAGTAKEFPNTEYACTVCGYKKTVAATTTVSAEQWTAAMNLGENFIIYAENVVPGDGKEVMIAKRAGNLFSYIDEEYAEGATTASDVSYSYGKIDGEVFYDYRAQYDQNEQFMGYSVEASLDSVQENIDEILADFFPNDLRDMEDYTYNSATCYYECAEAQYYGMTLQNIKVGFKDGKLVYVSFELAMGASANPSISATITYGGATVTLPAADQIITQN